MQIQQGRFLDFLGQAHVRFAIPVFQRVYSWDARQCEELWDDIMRVGGDAPLAKANDSGAEGNDSHFMGMLLYTTDPVSWNGCEQLDIIDGQQRLTTLSLLICALARHLDETRGRVEEGGAAELFDRYLRVGKGAGAACKLVLSNKDRETLFALVGTQVMPEEPASRLIDNLELFYAKTNEPGFDAALLWRGLNRLEVASVLLMPDDNPQLVFESLNSKGMALSLADRVRNFIVVTDDAAGNASLYEKSWLPFEQLATSGEEIDATTALSAWLAGQYRQVRIFDKSEVYGVFKTCLREKHGGSLESLLAEASAYTRKLLDDEEFRTEELENESRWAAGKPKELISEYRMFGD